MQQAEPRLYQGEPRQVYTYKAFILNNIYVKERGKLLTGITLEEEALLASEARGLAFESRRAYQFQVSCYQYLIGFYKILQADLRFLSHKKISKRSHHSELFYLFFPLR